MITADEQYRLDEIEQNLDTRKDWTKEDFEEFYDRDIELFLGIVKRGGGAKGGEGNEFRS